MLNYRIKFIKEKTKTKHTLYIFTYQPCMVELQIDGSCKFIASLENMSNHL